MPVSAFRHVLTSVSILFSIPACGVVLLFSPAALVMLAGLCCLTTAALRTRRLSLSLLRECCKVITTVLNLPVPFLSLFQSVRLSPSVPQSRLCFSNFPRLFLSLPRKVASRLRLNYLSLDLKGIQSLSMSLSSSPLSTIRSRLSLNSTHTPLFEASCRWCRSKSSC